MPHVLRSPLLATAATLMALFLVPTNTLAASYHSHSMLGSQGTHKTARAATLCGTPGAPTVCEYSYIYNTVNETVDVEDDVTFNNTGPSSSGIIHPTGSPDVILLTPGTYQVRYSVTGLEGNQFALMVNGFPVPETIYEVGGSEVQNTGEALITITGVSVITLQNHTSYGSIDLYDKTGGTQTDVNASLLIRQI